MNFKSMYVFNFQETRSFIFLSYRTYIQTEHIYRNLKKMGIVWDSQRLIINPSGNPGPYRSQVNHCPDYIPKISAMSGDYIGLEMIFIRNKSCTLRNINIKH